MKKSSPDSNRIPDDTSSAQNVTPPYRTHLTKLNTIIQISERLIESQTKSINDIVSNCSKICSGCEFHCMKILDICNQMVSDTVNSSYTVINMCQEFIMESDNSSSSTKDINNIPKRGRKPKSVKKEVKTSAPKSTILINSGSVENLGRNNGQLLSVASGMAFDVLEQNETFEPTKIKEEKNVTEAKVEQNVIKVKVEQNVTKVKAEKDDCPSSEDEIIDVVSEEPDRSRINVDIENHSEIIDAVSEEQDLVTESIGIEGRPINSEVREKAKPFDNIAVEDSSLSNDDPSSIVNKAGPSSQTNSGSEFTCSICSKKFKTETTFKKHKLYHDRYNFVCEVCNGRFAGKLKLKKHVLTQKDEEHVKFRMTKNFFSQVDSSVFIDPGSAVKLSMNDNETLSSSVGKEFDVLEQNETFQPTKIKVEDNLTKIKVEKDDCSSNDDEIIDVVSQEPERRQISSEVDDQTENKTEDHNNRDMESESSLEWSDSDALEYDDNVDDDPDWDAVKQVEDDNDSKFTCSVCTKTFENKKLYQRHKLSHRIKNNTKDFVCDVCDERFDMKHKLKTHIMSKTDKNHFKLHVAKNSVKVKRQCEICGKQYADMRYLERHLKIHSGVKEFACELCDYKGYSNEHLAKHMIRHTGIKKYICHHCGKRFPRNGELVKHLRCHSGIRAFHCDLCPKSFVLSTYLACHRKVHVEDLPYACEICGKRSRQKYNITVHMRTHTGHKPFSCEICGNKFAHNVSLRQHKKSCHGEIICKANGDMRIL